MLNCCIERKRARDEARKVLEENKQRERGVSSGCQNSSSVPESTTAMTSSSLTREVSPGKSWDSWSDSEDEFFECLSDQEEMEAPHTYGGKDDSKIKAEGRMHPHNNMVLLNSAEFLYVPVTQVRISLGFFTYLLIYKCVPSVWGLKRFRYQLFVNTDVICTVLIISVFSESVY